MSNDHIQNFIYLKFESYNLVKKSGS